jgi:hypothetical protein
MKPKPARSATRALALLAGLLLTSTLVQACSDDPSFKVGECVRIEQRAIDSDLKAADCADAVGTFDPTRRIYRVNEIIDNTDGGCPQLQGFFPVEFAHEPDGVTYCLVQEN